MRSRYHLIGVLSTALFAVTVAVCVQQREIKLVTDHTEVPVSTYVQDRQTGRIILGGTVKSDLDVAGQVLDAAGAGAR